MTKWQTSSFETNFFLTIEEWIRQQKKKPGRKKKKLKELFSSKISIKEYVEKSHEIVSFITHFGYFYAKKVNLRFLFFSLMNGNWLLLLYHS